MTQSRKWSLMALVVVLAILAAGWFLLVAPKKSEAADLRTQNESALSANNQLRAKLNELKALAPELPKREAEFATIRRQIPDNPALPDLIRQLSSAASKSGAELATLAPATPVAIAAPVASGTTAAVSDQLMLVPLAITVTGSYTSAEDFVDRLEKMRRLVMITGFTMASDTGDQAPGDVTLNLTGRVYMVNPAGAAATPLAGASPAAPAAAGTTAGTPSTEASAPAVASAN
jgi:Tfp pilus assembly protein PilO